MSNQKENQDILDSLEFCKNIENHPLSSGESENLEDLLLDIKNLKENFQTPQPKEVPETPVQNTSATPETPAPKTPVTMETPIPETSATPETPAPKTSATPESPTQAASVASTPAMAADAAKVEKAEKTNKNIKKSGLTDTTEFANLSDVMPKKGSGTEPVFNPNIPITNVYPEKKPTESGLDKTGEIKWNHEIVREEKPKADLTSRPDQPPIVEHMLKKREEDKEKKKDRVAFIDQTAPFKKLEDDPILMNTHHEVMPEDIPEIGKDVIKEKKSILDQTAQFQIKKEMITAPKDISSTPKKDEALTSPATSSLKDASGGSGASSVSSGAVKKKGWVKATVTFVICVAVAFLLAFLITKFVANHTTVQGKSMETTLQNGDNIIVENVSYLLGEPERFDIVVFKKNDQDNYVKRIIGLPGERIQIKEDHKIYINESPVFDSYCYEDMEEAGLAKKPIILGDDEYFVLGDNRNYSEDSRKFGPIKRDQILGKAFYRILPFKRFGRLK